MLWWILNEWVNGCCLCFNVVEQIPAKIWQHLHISSCSYLTWLVWYTGQGPVFHLCWNSLPVLKYSSIFSVSVSFQELKWDISLDWAGWWCSVISPLFGPSPPQLGLPYILSAFEGFSLGILQSSHYVDQRLAGLVCAPQRLTGKGWMGFRAR